MSLFRSERMGYFNINMPKESSWEILNDLGQISCLEFIDQNPNEAAFNRPFSNMIKRLEETDQKLRLIETEMKKFDMSIRKCEDAQMFLQNWNLFLGTRNKAENTYYEEIENEIEVYSQKLLEQIKNYEQIEAKINYLTEYKAVLYHTKDILGENPNFRGKNIEMDDEEGEGREYYPEDAKVSDAAFKGAKLNYIAGAIDKEDTTRFKRMIFRVTKGNNWTYMQDVDLYSNQYQSDDQKPIEKKSKTVFLIVYQGGIMDIIKQKINRICESFSASRFNIPTDQSGFMKANLEIDNQLGDNTKLLSLTRNTIEEMLTKFSHPRLESNPYSFLEELKIFLTKEKTIYLNLNLMKLNNQVYTGFCWIPLDSKDRVDNQIKQLLQRKPDIQRAGGLEIKRLDREEDYSPPTYFKVNDFTASFQEIVNTYGIPRYREVNPGLFAIIMFPFLFGIMFGDIGHGGVLFFIGLYMCICAKEIKEEKSFFAPLLDARYLIAIMGFFAFYCGWIYNDFFSMPINVFGSCYVNKEGSETEKIKDCVYPFGLDPKWYIASNELNFFNSLKMKCAVIIGVCQMIFGIMLKGINAINFRLPLDFLFEFIPQLIFMCSTFGYMIMIIFYKWSVNWEEVGTEKAPGIINVMINLPLKLGSTEGKPLYDEEQQESIQFNLLIIAVLCVPLMLFVKPLIQLAQNSGKKPEHGHDLQQALLHDQEMDEAMEDEKIQKQQVQVQSHGHGHGEFEFGEVFVHQVIETIEFVLGSISNTASYLRLWALSLAHGQLAKVFFEKTVGGGISSGSFMMVFIGFFIFFNITLGVLMCMDLMECFLHALRLQWVEFQNKFYKADGRKFSPFSFDNIILDTK